MTNDYAAAFGRLMIATVFVLSGLGKIAAPAVTQAYIASTGLPLPIAGYLIAIAVEVGGAVFTLATAVFFHNNFADQNQMIHFLKNIVIAGGLFQVAAFGAGSLSIDALRLKGQRRVLSHA